MRKYRRIPPYHGSSKEIMNKDSLVIFIVIGGEVDEEGNNAIDEYNTK